MAATLEGSPLLPMIRAQVRDRLLGIPAYRGLSREQQTAIAHDTVKAIHYIVGGADGYSQPRSVEFAGDSPIVRELADKPPLPEGDTAGQRFGQTGAVAARTGSDAFTEMIASVNFPKFVEGLIDGVFNAIVHSSIKQMEAYAELVANVAKTVEQFMKDNVTENNARDYLVDRYPHVFELDISGDQPRVKPRDGIDSDSMPDWRADLGTTEEIASLDESTVEEQLVPAARRRIAMDRQQLLATMVMMGVNRLVVTNGIIEASCLFELNTTDMVKRRMKQKRTADWAALRQGESGAAASYSRSGGGWFSDDTDARSSWFTKDSYRYTSNFNVSTTRSEDSDAKVQMHAKLAGKVNLNFKSDYFPMEKMIDALQINQIRARTPAGGTQPPPGAAAPPAAARPAAGVARA